MLTSSPARGWPVSSALVACLAAAAVFTAVPAAAQPPQGRELELDFLKIGQQPAADQPVVEMRLTPETVRPGQEVAFSVTVRLPKGGYTYSINPEVRGHTRIDVTKSVGLEPLGKRFEPSYRPKVEFEPLFEEDVEKHLKDVTWSRKYRVASDASGEVELTGKLRYQVCDASTCRPFTENIAVSANVAGGKTFAHKERVAVNDRPGPAEVRAELSPTDAKPGDHVRLSVTLELDDGWHTYAIWDKKVLGASPTKIEVGSMRGLEPLSDEFTPDLPAERKEIAELNVVHEVFHDQVTWSRDFKVTAPKYGLAGSITYQTCDDNRCLLPKTVAFVLGEPPAPAASGPAAPRKVRASGPATATGNAADAGAPAVDGNTGAEQSPAGIEAAAVATPQALIPFVLAAIGFGLGSLFTPCVFPMVPITVSFFLKQSEQEHHQPVTMALVYCGTIVLTFTGIGLLIAGLYEVTDLNRFANGPWLNLFIAGVLIFFGLNLLGLFEIRVPGWLLTWTAGKESRGGYVGAVFMALTFTLVSFTCTFAFVGFLLVLASKGEYFWPIVGMLAFSVAFALPFFFLALFPSMLQKLPKSGGWMNRVKVTMAMIELGAAFKFLSVADLSWNPVAKVFDYSLVLTAWLVISASTGVYLLGLFRLSHDTPSESISVPRFVVAMSFLGFAAYLGAGLFAPEKPGGVLWDLVYSQLPPRYQAGTGEDIGPYLEEGGLKYALDYEPALEHARQTGQPVFIDFTGENCANCRLMEKRMLQPALHERLARFVRIKVYADSVPTYTEPEESVLLAKNRSLQVQWFGDVTLPSYAIVTPDRRVLAKLTGQTDATTFAQFLDEGLANWQQIAATDARLARR